jgi:tetrahydromethanopterin S-methyltransferase subunit E
MTPQRLRAYVQTVVGFLVIPLAGIALTFYLVRAHQFEYWQLPLLAGMMGVPLVASSGSSEGDEPRPDRRSEPESEG